jgi:hypothetical protein
LASDQKLWKLKRIPVGNDWSNQDLECKYLCIDEDLCLISTVDKIYNECVLHRWPTPYESGESINSLLDGLYSDEKIYYCDASLRNSTSPFLNIKKASDAKGIRVKSLNEKFYKDGVFSSIHSTFGLNPWFNGMDSVYDPQQNHNDCMDILPNSDKCGQNKSSLMDPNQA